MKRSTDTLGRFVRQALDAIRPRADWNGWGATAMLAAVAVLMVTGAGRSLGDEPKLRFNKDVRPILADACFACHGPDSASRKADLRLDQRDTAIEMGAITPGDPEYSEMIRRILSTDPEEKMPPPETKKTLTDEQCQILQRWVAEGAEYELHWSLIPPTRPEPPAVSKEGAHWVRNPIDSFILARLEKEGLHPAPEADRRTLARRASLDITGLLPDPHVVEAFVNDPSPDAYGKYIDKLLDSVHWGEHRGRYWLDYARYADTHGIHFDNYREMWSYRDWVIQAFNNNMPFDQFTIENLAGDLLPDRTLDQQIGSGFNRCNMTTNEGEIIDEEYRVLYARDRTETTAQVWLGLTAGCAVCHNHKFDPLSQQEFYELSAFFNNTTQPVRDGNVKDTPPVVTVPLKRDRERWEAIPGELVEVDKKIKSRREDARPEFETWLASATVDSLGSDISPDRLALHAPLDEGRGATIEVKVGAETRSVPVNAAAITWQEGISGPALSTQGVACEVSDFGDFEKERAFSVATWVKVPASDDSGAICARMDTGNEYRGWDVWVQRRQIGTHLIHSWPNNALKVVGKKQIPANQWVHVAITYDGSGSARGVKVYYNGEPQETNVENDKLRDTIRTNVPFTIGQRTGGEPYTGAIQDLKVVDGILSPAEVLVLANRGRFAATLAKPVADRDPQEVTSLYEYWLQSVDKTYQQLSQHKSQLEAEKSAIQSRGTIAHVMEEAEGPPTAYVLYRGEYDQRREQVFADTPEVLPPFPEGAPRNRLGFAQWLLLPEHPLTARVTVNRFWQEVFGTGIVATTGDFGVSGEVPSHPELLDWLAVEFRESGWDVKRFFKLMLMSATYRQAAVITPEKLEKDGANRLLSRGPRFRMDAEMVRDMALKASGLLVPEVGGPSVKPYQPPGVWEAIAMNVSNTRSYERDKNEDLYRRSVYTFVKRMAPPASMEIFNAPNREFCVVRRERTNTPLQALVTLNDEQFIEAARHLAQNALRPPDLSTDERVQQMGLALLSRPFREEELAVIRSSLEQLTAHYGQHEEDARQLLEVGDSPVDETLPPTQLAAWTMLANQLINLDEVLNK